MKNKNQWYKNQTMIFSIIAGIGILGTAIVKSATYITLPDRVEAAEEKIKTVEDYIKEQRISNELMREMFKQQQPTCEQDKDGVWWCWDYKSQQWYKQGGQ